MNLEIHDVKEVSVRTVSAFPATETRTFPFWLVELNICSGSGSDECRDRLVLFFSSPPEGLVEGQVVIKASPPPESD